MNVLLSRIGCAVLAVFAWCAFVVPATFAQSSSAPTQVLDRVDAYGLTRLIEMQFSDPNRTADFIDDGITGGSFFSCKLTAAQGLYCLDGRTVKRWPNPKHPAESVSLFRCDDPALGLDAKKLLPCTSMTVDDAGSIWLAARRGLGHNLIKIVPQDGSVCPAGFTRLVLAPTLCARTYASGRPLIVDASAIDGEAADTFNPTCATCPRGAGVLALEGATKVMFYPDQPGAAPVLVARGKSGWGLKKLEVLLSATLLQLPGSTPDTRRSFVVATTSFGRLLAVDTASTAAPFEVFNIPAERQATSRRCGYGLWQYGLRASDQSGRVYVTDRNYCQVLALEPVLGTSADPFELANVLEAGQDLTLATGGIFVDSTTVAPGISIDLDDCFEGCTLVSAPDGTPAATITGVQLGSVQSGLTLFQVKDIPDCRWIPATCQTLLGVGDLVAAGVIVDPYHSGQPSRQYLNVTPLLPAEIRDQYDDSGVAPAGLPPLLISPQYRAQAANGFLFQAFFGITEDGVIFRDVADGEFDVAALAGSELGCVLGYPRGTPVSTLLQWDVATLVSEKHVGIDGRYVDTMVNVGCGSSRLVIRGKSLLPYNLELTPTGGTMIATSSYSSPSSDPVFRNLLAKLYGEFEDVRSQLACVDVDSGTGSAAPPLSAANCSTLASIWSTGQYKLDRCLAAAAATSRYVDTWCPRFETQLVSLDTALAGMSPNGLDPANRVGDLVGRVKVLLHVYRDRFLPSVPPPDECHGGETF